MNMPAARRIGPLRAFLANLVGLGLGYVYVGELGLGLATVAVTFCVFFLFSWSRLIVSSAQWMWIDATILLVVSGIALIHPIVIAFRQREHISRWYNRYWFYIVWIMALGVLPYFLITDRAIIFGYEPFRTPTVSMSPTVEKNEFFMTDTWRYHSHPPEFGEIVVFKGLDSPGIKYIKRIVGLPGDRIEMRDAVLFRNGHAVSEPYVHPIDDAHSYGRNFGPVVIGPDAVFVLGDFRDNSLDSRRWGPIPISNLHGRAQYIWFSLAGGDIKWDRIGTSLLP